MNSPMNRSNVDEIKARLPIEEIIGQYVKLEKAGKSYKARCPFHNEKTASFFISPDRGGYYCFGCGAKGDIFSFVEQFEGLDFRGALKILAERAGVKLTFDKKIDSDRDRLYRIMEDAAAFFEAEFAKSKDAQAYMKDRGVKDEIRAEFRIGFAPEGWQNLSSFLRSRGWNESVMEKAGLIKRREVGSPNPSSYDRFRGRIMFPITDSSSRVIAFSGRVLKDDGKSAKYLNSPDTPLFDKSLVLYGLDKAKAEIRRLNYSILVEGQMDLIMSHQAGVKNTVASSGTALSGETEQNPAVHPGGTLDAQNETATVSNLGLVRRLSRNMIIAFDSDFAGRKAAMRASGIALGMGMDVKIADIVGGKDPADLVRDGVEKWKDILRAAKPVIEFELDNVVREIGDRRKLAKAVQDRVLPLLARIESSSDQSNFVVMIADRTKIPTDSIWQDVKIVAKRLKDAASAPAASPSGPSSATGASSPSASSRVSAKTSAEMGRRIDLVERRMFGLLDLMESAKSSKAAEYREQIRRIAGDSYETIAKAAGSIMGDLLFEAEAFFGDADERWDIHMKELILNFEVDLINQGLMSAMQDLRAAEKAGDQARVAELAKRCQALSIRKAEAAKRGRQ